jgi:hypothetical protein
MEAWLKFLWGDPVWSKFIAVLIVAVGSTLWAAIHLNWWERFRVAYSAAWRNQHQFTPRFTVIQVTATAPDRVGLAYPVKCYVELRNDSEGCVDVRISYYRPARVPAKKVLLNVVQIYLGSWVPAGPDEVDRIAVLPRQLFRLWIAIDEQTYTPEKIMDLRGNIGEIVFTVNDGHVIVSI